MPTPAESTQNFADWVTREEAARLIGVSTKTISKLERERKLERKNRPVKGKPPMAIYHPDDVRRLADHYRRMSEPGILAAGDGDGRHSSGKALAVARNPFALVEALLHASTSSKVPLTDRVYLRIPEAIEYSGLPERYLRELVKQKKLSAITEGVRGWRIRRTDLDKL